MALPAGALQATITAGTSAGIAGTAGTVVSLTVRPESRLTWAATGEAIERWAEPAVITDGASSLVVLADQDGVLTSGTVAGAPAMLAIRGWTLRAEWYTELAGHRERHVRRFPAPAAGVTVDLDMLPEAGVPTPATITYAQTITIGGGASSAITADDTPAAPAEGESASYFVTAAVSWPAGLVWSTDPDGGVAPTITETALVSMFTVGGTTRAILGATFPAVVAPDTTNPTAGTLASSAITATGFTLTASGAADAGGLHAQPYSFDTGTGTFGAWQTAATLAVTGKTAGTAYTCRHKVRDAAGNESTGSSITVTTTAVDTTAPVWTATLTPGTPTETAVVVAASALATDNVGVTGYEVSYNNGTTWAAIVPSGSNFTLNGSAGVTYATTKLRAKDAAGNTSTPVLSVPSYTMAASADVTAPTVGTMAASAITSSGFTLTVSGASDAGSGLHAQPYSFTTDGGTTYSAYQASPVYVVTGKAASTGYSCNWRVRDAATTPNVATGTAQTVTTGATLLAFVTSATTPTDGTSHTFSGVSFGAEAAARQIVIALAYTHGGDAVPPTSITIGGVAATIDFGRYGTVPHTAIARATVPTGTTGDVVVVYPALCYRSGIGVYRSAVALTKAATSDTDTSHSVSIANPSGGVVVAGGVRIDGAVAWSGATQDYQATIESGVTTTSASTTTTGALAISIGSSAQYETVAAVAYTAA